jgi:hypothetical protein
MIEESAKIIDPPEGFPPSISVLNFEYQIIYYDKDFRTPDDNCPLDGQCDHSAQQIRIAVCNYAPRRIWHCIWHEVVHAIMKKLDISRYLDSSVEEHFVDLISLGIIDVIWENKLHGETLAKKSRFAGKKDASE